jgi:hypothetical protein
MTHCAEQLVADKYSPARERADVVRVFGQALERVKDREPQTRTIVAGMLPKRGLHEKFGERILGAVRQRS